MPPLPTSSAESIRHPFVLRSLFPSLHGLSPRSPAADWSFLPTRTVSPANGIPLSLASLFRRQVVTVTATALPPTQTTTTPVQTTPTPTGNPLIPITYSGLNSGPQPGTVVGIVFGSVAGFLLLLWLIYTCFGLGGGNVVAQSAVVDEQRDTEIREVRRRSRSRRTSTRRSSPRRASSSHSASEVIEEESRRERTPPRREPVRRETVIIEETRRQRPPEDDFVEVIEEHSPVRRESTKRRVSGGYRTVDPEAFGGGNRPQRKVRR